MQIKLDNKCNIGCRSCNPFNSNYLEKRFKIFNENGINLINFKQGNSNVQDSWLTNGC